MFVVLFIWARCPDIPIPSYNSALFVQPRYSKLLNTKQIKEVMGVPPEGAAVAPIAIPPAISVKA